MSNTGVARCTSSSSDESFVRGAQRQVGFLVLGEEDEDRENGEDGRDKEFDIDDEDEDTEGSVREQSPRRRAG
jgi:hypothetical protein